MRRSMLEAHERATNMGRVEMTVGDFRSVWLDDCAGRLTPKTIHFYGWVCDLPMMKPIRALNLNDVTPRQIAKTVAQVTEQHGRRTGLAAFRLGRAMGLSRYQPVPSDAGSNRAEARADGSPSGGHGTCDQNRNAGVWSVAALCDQLGMPTG